MKSIVLLLIVVGLVLSCASLPPLHPAGRPMTVETNQTCQGLYPHGEWQLYHTIEAKLPGRQSGFLMGLTVLSSRERSAQCVIMTLEGFVVFDARYDGQVTIKRAVAPFDNHAFAQGVMADIQLIFFKPLADEISMGVLSDNVPVCRHLLPDGNVIDLVNPENNHWETRLYRSNHRVMRIVQSMIKDKPPGENLTGIADKIELTALGTPGYTLILDLVEAIPLNIKEPEVQGSE
jgi:hypothetical protein